MVKDGQDVRGERLCHSIFVIREFFLTVTYFYGFA